MDTVDQEIAASQEEAMDEYTRINQCIELLKGSNLSTIKKLRIEIQLIQLKRHLLNDDFHVTVSFGKVTLAEVLAEMTRICAGRYDGTLTDQIERLSWMLSTVGSQELTGTRPVTAEAFPSCVSATA